MNERIWELAEQAWKEILDETSIDGDISTMFSSDEVVAFEQKFAELIVKECAMLVEGFILEQEVALDDYQEYEASAVLKEHFGVEE